MILTEQCWRRIYQNPHITIERGNECAGTFRFTKDNKCAKIKIVKKESSDLTYKVAVFYLGTLDGKSRWILKINDGSATGIGSKSIVMKPVEKQIIERLEIDDENRTESQKIDLSGDGYRLCGPRVIIASEKIQSIAEKEKIVTKKAATKRHGWQTKKPGLKVKTLEQRYENALKLSSKKI